MSVELELNEHFVKEGSGGLWTDVLTRHVEENKTVNKLHQALFLCLLQSEINNLFLENETEIKFCATQMQV